MPRRLVVLFLALSVAIPAAAQSPFASVKWRSIGPVNTAGRIDDIAVARIRGEPDAIYVATASGGLWKSANNGVSFSPIFDGVDAMMSIGAVAVAPSAPTTVWIGTGEANTRQSSSWGDGMYKSTDGGKTWANMGLKDTKSVGRIVIDPANADVVYVAAGGHLWGPNAERGVFKTADGGKTWSKVLYVDENTGANDIVMDPANPQTLYASTYQRQRRTWGFNGGGPGSGIYKTIDGGANWTKLTAGLPAGDKGRIALSLHASDPKVVFATVEARAADAGTYRTVDAGTTWEKVSSLNTRPNYFSQIRVDPRDREHVYQLGSNRGFYFSNDGGKAWTELFSNVHGEDHALWVDPDNGNHLIIGGDGGVSISWDRGRTWDFRRNMPLGQFYEVDVDQSVPFRICGGLQDNGVWCVPSAVRDRNGIADRDAWNIGGGDGFHAHFDPANNNMVLQSSQNGNAAWVNIETLERQGTRPGTGDRAAAPAAAAEGALGGPGTGGGRGGYRWNWDTPIIVSHQNPKTWYMGAQMLFKSTDRGSSWQKISGDLTLNVNRDTLKMMGKVVPADALSRHDGQTSYGSLTSIGESPVNPLVVYTGSDDGQVQLTRDGGKSWTNITSKISGVPDQTYVSTVLPSKYKAGRVYVTFDGHYSDDYKPYVFVSDDFGATWRSLSAGLPETSVNRIREHPKNEKVLILAHERGVHVSNDGGATWSSLATNMPTVSVDDAVFQERDNALVVGTHGRGIWVLDDVGPLETLTPSAVAANATLLPIAHARLMSTHSPQAWYGAGEFFAPNPEWNAVIAYNLRDAASGQTEVAVMDAQGKVIRTLKGPVLKGVNRVVWDLRYAPPVDSANVPVAGGRGGGGGRGGPPAAVPVGFPAGGEGGGGRGGAPLGPTVLPGRYSVRVTVPGVAPPLASTIVVEGDPLPKFTVADRAARQAVLMKIYDWTKSLGNARIAARALVAQRDSIKADLHGDASADSLNAHIGRTAADVDRALTAVNAQRAPVEGWSGLPSIDQRAATDHAIEDARKAVADVNRLIATDVPAAYKLAGKKEWPRKISLVAAPPR
ncbi:MAG: glycosyl hydrolase, repeat [Gemmatimonadetes bacterium]|nr:glycosyl hydrolase, repeat [Gemmatimonadota bacterium]